MWTAATVHLDDVASARSGQADLVQLSGRLLLEVVAVSLSGREQRILNRMADQLAASDPELVSFLEIFCWLAWSETTQAGQLTAARPANRTGVRRRRVWRAVSRYLDDLGQSGYLP
jgi:hypothetical protein